jgi:hypothetical protein
LQSPEATAVISNNTISNNFATSWGGGLLVGGIDFDNMRFIITNNTIVNNSCALQGGGINVYLEHDRVTADLYNNIVWNNDAPEGADLALRNDVNMNGDASPVNLFHNDFDHRNPEGIYIQVDFPIPSSNLDNIDPSFVEDPLNDDYHLTSDSPCIDMGDDNAPGHPDTDFEGDPRPFDGDGDGLAVTDIGADEFQPFDLDISRFNVTKRVSLSREKPIAIILVVQNTGTADGRECPATVVGIQNSIEVYNETVYVSDPVGKGPSTCHFPDCTPEDPGDIQWTATITDYDPDADEATASTIVNP